ncbi:MAG: hypothetical protein KIT56_02130 [Gammaproteobacteria bacterium]|nr:hypothetical protein [Gammaproteobacteria bacterium]
MMNEEEEISKDECINSREPDSANEDSEFDYEDSREEDNAEEDLSDHEEEDNARNDQKIGNK